MSKHTPGPWNVQPGYYPGFLEVVGASFTISVVTLATDLTLEDSFKRTADALLIAAAPDLLAALEFMVANIGEPACLENRDGFAAARAAIARAKGESQ